MYSKHFLSYQKILLDTDHFELKPASDASTCACPLDTTAEFPFYLLAVFFVLLLGILLLVCRWRKSKKPQQAVEGTSLSPGVKVVVEPTPPDAVQEHRSESEHVERDGAFSCYEMFTKVCLSHHIIERNAFSMLNCNLGSGKFSQVTKGVLKLAPDNVRVHVAVKKFKFLDFEKDSTESFLREIKTFEMIGTENEYIVKFLGACCHKEGLYLLTEYCEGGSLRKYLIEKMRPKIFPNVATKNEGNGYFTMPTPKLDNFDLCKLLHWCEQIACGMEYLGRKGIIHVDLACRNILLSGDGKVKICDFGLSRKCSNTENYAHTFLSGDFPFNSFAPECVKETTTKKTKLSVYMDVWAFGCTVWEIFTIGNDLYPEVSGKGFEKYLAVRNLLLENYRHDPPPLAPDFVSKKLMECWDEIPRNRPKFTDLRVFFAAKREILGD